MIEQVGERNPHNISPAMSTEQALARFHHIEFSTEAADVSIDKTFQSETP